MPARASQDAKLKEIRDHGFWRFVLVRGVLRWGVVTAVLYSLIMWVIGDKAIGSTLVCALVTFPIAGIAWGAAMWLFVDRKVRKLS